MRSGSRSGDTVRFWAYGYGMRKFRLLPIAAAAAAFACAGGTALADGPVMHVRGTVSSIHGDSVTVTTATGDVTVIVDGKTRFAQVVPASANDITTGTFIGTANAPRDGMAHALEVVVFPAAMKGTGEGDYPWDLAPSPGHMSSMTNGTVVMPKMSMSSMTNATVSNVKGNGVIKTVQLSYKGGTKTVAIDPNTPVVRVGPGSRMLLVTGAHVVVTPGMPAAKSVVIGEKGATPPM